VRAPPNGGALHPPRATYKIKLLFTREATLTKVIPL
jgi:hypothetical protein